MMKKVLYILVLFISFSFAQEDKKPQDIQHIYQGNVELKENDFVNAEAEYRKAISENPVNATSKYNLGNAYYQNKKNKEAVARYVQAIKVAKTKEEKHEAYHNMGNSFMQQKKYDQAINAYKNALRNNPSDDETRYNLALAKKEKENQKNKKNDDKNEDTKDKDNKNKGNKDQKEDNKEGDDKEDKKDQGDKDNKENDKDQKGDKEEDKKGDDKKDDKKDSKNDQGDDKEEKEKEKQLKPGQLSPQQVQSLLEAMNNQEKKLQEKLNAKKAKGVPVQNEKDW
ncbi:tetratricopeptide repeat protein [Pseudofulvibacter geojedonensis]|uniref:Tetratricopeptide repeat protein n=1 Tax=Pseudofulvibacter geojedonensis TaxID=1123758 RepID=A0ABW3I032_9FLAO